MPTILNEIADFSDEKGNVVTGKPALQRAVSITFKANNCTLEVDPTVRLYDTNFVFEADDSHVKIGKYSQFVGMMLLGLKSKIIIGEKLSVTRYCFISAAEMSAVTIGNDCMFASQNELRTDDAHPIFDIQTGVRVNPSKSIVIGNHVWLAAHAIVLGGVEIGSGSIIGHSSLVTSTMPASCVAIGKPARVVREGVVWDRAHVAKQHPHYFPDISTVSAPYRES